MIRKSNAATYKIITFLFLALLEFGGGTSLIYGTNFNVSVDPVTWTGDSNFGYEMFTPVEYVQEENFDVTYDNGDEGNFFVTFSKGNASNYNRYANCGAQTINYQIFDSLNRANVLKEIPEASNNSDVLAGIINANDSSPFSMQYYIGIPPQQIVAPGTYTDSFTVSVYEGTIGGSRTLAGSATVNLSIVISSVVDVSLVESGSSFDEADVTENINFGVLNQGDHQEFDLVIRGNSSYAISLQSANGQKLKNENPSISTDISYTLEIDSNQVNLTNGNPVQVATGSGQTPITGSAHPISITIGDVSGKVDGTYSDSITVTTTSN
jgi:spore coat protein U-like protein